MDDETHRIIQEACALDDEAKRQHERWRYDFDRRQQQRSIEPAERQVARPADRAVAATTTMSAEQSKPWNSWARGHVDVVRQEYQKEIDELIDVVGEYIGKHEQRIRDLEARTDAEVDQSKIVPFLTLRGGRDVA